MSEPQTKQSILNLTIKDKNALYMSYMPFIKNGGLFIPTKKNYQLGDEVFMLINLMEETDRIAVNGKIVWITPQGAQANHRMSGIGVQFNDQQIRVKIDTYLAGFKADRPSYTF